MNLCGKQAHEAQLLFPSSSLYCKAMKSTTRGVMQFSPVLYFLLYFETVRIFQNSTLYTNKTQTCRLWWHCTPLIMAIFGPISVAGGFLSMGSVCTQFKSRLLMNWGWEKLPTRLCLNVICIPLQCNNHLMGDFGTLGGSRRVSSYNIKLDRVSCPLVSYVMLQENNKTSFHSNLTSLWLMSWMGQHGWHW